MSKIHCVVFCHANTEHLQILYTGFAMLSQQGKISLQYKILKNLPASLPKLSPAELLVEINENTRVVFDMGDFGEMHSAIYESIHAYIKRSFPLHINISDNSSPKLIPLGLTYNVHEIFPSWFEFRRAQLEPSMLEQTKSIFRSAISLLSPIFPKYYRFNPKNCFEPPNFSLPPKVIFMCRLWDPADTKPKYREQRELINQQRADCVRKLRAEFGSQFTGGLAHNAYTVRYYPDCLLEDPRLSDFHNYVQLMRKHSIGVATTGLHDSIGWKFAECVAFSKAVVSEKLCFYVPELEEGKNYLSFSTAEECVEQVSLLMQNKVLREEFMMNNYQHYLHYMQPDVMVWRAISSALRLDSENPV